MFLKQVSTDIFRSDKQRSIRSISKRPRGSPEIVAAVSIESKSYRAAEALERGKG